METATETVIRTALSSFPTPPGRVWAQESMAFAQCIAQQMETAGHRLRSTNGIRFAYYEGKPENSGGQFR